MFTYEAVRDWEAKLTPALAEELRRSRKSKVGRSWYIDETYIRVHGQWKYLYRAIDRDGALVDVMLSDHRDLAAAKRFFRSAKAVTSVIPDRVTTDGHDAYRRAIRTELGSRFAAVTTSSGTSSALDLACANTFPLPHGASTICAGQRSRSVFWKLLEQRASQPESVGSEWARKLTEPRPTAPEVP